MMHSVILRGNTSFCLLVDCHQHWNKNIYIYYHKIYIENPDLLKSALLRGCGRCESAGCRLVEEVVGVDRTLAVELETEVSKDFTITESPC